MLALMARRRTRFVRFALCAQTAAPSETYEARYTRGHEPCASRRLRTARRSQPERTFAAPSRHAMRAWLGGAGAAGGAPRGDFFWDEQRPGPGRLPARPSYP